MNIPWSDIVGAVGALLIVGCHVMLQTGKVAAKTRRYSIVNAVGAALVLISLVFKFNFSAFVVESLWLIASLLPLARNRDSREKQRSLFPDVP